MKSVCLLLASLLFAGSAVFAQDHPAITALPNSLYVGADGKYEAAPDTAQIQFNISVQEATPQAAFEKASKNVEQVRQVLRANGIEPAAANIGFLSVQPTYQWDKGKQALIGYRVTSNVTLKLKDFTKVGPITQQLADANISETQTLNYTLQNVDDAKNKAVEDAYRRARNSADTLAHASGRALGELLYASVDTFEAPRLFAPRAMMAPMKAMAAAAPPAPTEEFTPQTVTVTAHVNALFNLK
ncbi:MAG TPA: SIMPL domain-containing protein [Candidatus Sulfotelmatobacter sp.]|nr:SIMPL domain-containing protein [Candidatus Sulfotelmatobacter sp.]HXP46647.1 SIMPL domain-containing protein [Terriglobales bacterium]